MQIEQMKQKTIADRDAMDAKLKASELLQKDQHKRMELENEREIAQAQMQDKAARRRGQDAGAEPEGDGEPRGASGAHAGEPAEDGRSTAQKAAMAMQAHQNKQQDMASRANERQMAAAQKRNNGIGGLG